MSKKIIIAITCIIFTAIFGGPIAHCAESQSVSRESEFDRVFNATPSADGVRKITYDQLAEIRNSGEEFFLVDVLSSGDYKTGHIAGAMSMPLKSISESYAKKMIPAGSRVIVYCNGFECNASSDAARKLSGYGYKVLDYKGGLEEWQSRGGKLVK